MKTLKTLYLQVTNIKLYTGLYFSALVFLVGGLYFLLGRTSISLFILAQMLVVGVLISLLQVWLLPDYLDLTKQLFVGRSISWLVCIMLITSFVAYWGTWFEGLANWCPLILGVMMGIGCIFLLIRIKLEQDHDTNRLNEALQQYKTK